MSLQSEITTWRDAYDETGIGTHNPAYIGSILAVNGNYYTGNGIYDPSAAAPTYEIYDFNWYAGQGIDSNTSFGGKYLLYSESGFSWDTTYNSAIGSYSFVTNGSLDNLYLGYNPTSDTGVAPAASTLTTFDAYEPLLVVSGFDIAVDAVASSVFGVADGNSAISVSNSTFSGILANASLYDSATLNSAVIYSLAFDNTDVSAFEFVLDNYLGSLG
ncbi:hypothetical protein HC231_02755 [Brenneria izadpanahii]|uniref:Hemophore HasA n=1 Tax=Brenneria izadpanahii TaxID=2722756 RepID=A0ABX7URY9_9GAMM|nr:hypothetical protein [Brenneria izadpanahii]QTF06965.1 hypothetical protein HC231_02755 [Brenneria izadpanahii]